VDEGRHVNFGYFALRRSIPTMEAAKRESLEDFCLRACDLMYARDERTGFQGVKAVWNEMGWHGEKICRDTVASSPTTRAWTRAVHVPRPSRRLEPGGPDAHPMTPLADRPHCSRRPPRDRIPVRHAREGCSPTGFIRHARRTTDKSLNVTLNVRPRPVGTYIAQHDGELR
jgi:hypothetical protein